MIKFTHKIANCSVEDDQRGVSVYLNICLKAEDILYNPRGPAPCPTATTAETQTPKSSALGLKVRSWSVTVSSFILSIRNKSAGICSSKQSRGHPCSCQPASNFPTSQALSRMCLPVLLPLKCPAAAAAKSLPSCPTLLPHRRQPTRLPHPWDSAGKNTGVGCHVLLQCMKVKSENEVTLLCPTLSYPMDCSPPGSSVYRIFQARVLEWVAIAFSA